MTERQIVQKFRSGNGQSTFDSNSRSVGEYVLILLDIKRAPQGRATLYTENLKTKQRTTQRD